MKVDIPGPFVYMGTGILVDRVIQNIFGNNIKYILDNILYGLSEKQRLKQIETRRVVDVNGDTLGYFDIEGNIVKGGLNDY